MGLPGIFWTANPNLKAPDLNVRGRERETPWRNERAGQRERERECAINKQRLSVNMLVLDKD